MFASRHIGTSDRDQKLMLEQVGYESLDQLMAAALPESIKLSGELKLAGLESGIPDEHAALGILRQYADLNRLRTSMAGQGFYNSITPAVIRRNIFENPSWYTSYTPYQPEISQGRLEMLLNFQTMICDLTGMDVANASMLDEASCAAEAMLLARRANKKSKSSRYAVHRGVFPSVMTVLQTRAEAVGIELVEIDDAADLDALAGDYFGVYVQYPAASGQVLDPQPIFAKAKQDGAVSVAGCDLLALTLFASPGELGADIAMGSSQRLGVPMGFGGPAAAFLAVRQGMERILPGRLVGVSVDADGNPAYRLTLQAREQHIRREKATSNICTATVLMAILATAYAQYHGPQGLRAIAARVSAVTRGFAGLLAQKGFAVSSDEVFDTIEIKAGAAEIDQIIERAEQLLFYRADEGTLRLSFDEVTARLEGELPDHLARAFGLSAADIRALADAAEAAPHAAAETAITPAADVAGTLGITARTYLTHPAFNTYTSETALMRYLKQLADKDFALDRGMIPLGSCTMKLNAAAQMEPVSWPEFANLHPFAPAEDTAGTLKVIEEVERWLAQLSGYDTVSLQPNAGSQGELAGLLAIRNYYMSLNQQRDICLIPQSAHGTNAASAVLAGMRVVIVACDDNGNVDVDDLKAKAREHADQLAVLMITYPSTHGVYEERVREICDIIHEFGGQVYVDGANFNALLGYSRMGDFGGDVSHLNLHKTFAIPHGGGGPGIGPVAAKAHLAKFLPAAPGQRQGKDGETYRHEGGAVTSTPYGFAGALYISWAYMVMLGMEGMKRSTASAVLAANYIAKRLNSSFPVLYRGKNDLVAHECILDLRPLTALSGVTADDICKRLIDYGFHAPTMSFPVAGTLMVEPTESEPLDEIERFIAAMEAIRAEIEEIIQGKYTIEESPLRNAPHTIAQVSGDSWERAYPRSVAAAQAAGTRPAPADVAPVSSPGAAARLAVKYWPPVSRIDHAYGDRNLFCSCPDPADFQ